MKRLITLMALLLLPLMFVAAEAKWNKSWPDTRVSYRKAIGKKAYNNSTNPPVLRGIKLGKIVGVSWRPKGSMIGVSEAIPAAGIPESIRKSPRDAYYYIIDDGSEKPFLRQCREIDAK